MTLDSSLSTYRGKNAKGLWINEEGEDLFVVHDQSYTSLANPDIFVDDPEVGWGFHSYMEKLYRNTTPHRGYNILNDICKDKDYFVVTSNVDGHHKTPDDRLIEVHGNCHYWQCSNTSKVKYMYSGAL